MPTVSMNPSPNNPIPIGDNTKSRLIVISNRLPITITKKPDGNGWNYKMSSGGLVSALSGLKKEMEFTWIGWPGNILFSGFFFISFILCSILDVK